MALPDFFSRVADSLRPVADVDAEVLARKLDGTTVYIELASADPGAEQAFLLACNLAARLYPRIGLHAGRVHQGDDGLDDSHPLSDEIVDPAATVSVREASAWPPGDPVQASRDDLVDVGARLIASINPHAQVLAATSHRRSPSPDHDTNRSLPVRRSTHDSDGTPTSSGVGPDVDGPVEDHVLLRVGDEQAPRRAADGGEGWGPEGTMSDITVAAHGWNVSVDPPAVGSAGPEATQPLGHPLAWLAAGALGMAEVFRRVFNAELAERGRTRRQPGSLNLLTSRNQDPADAVDDGVDGVDGVDGETAGFGAVDLGEVYLVGAGAIGQAAVYALRHLEATGVLHVVDPETVTTSNLQRYLLTSADSVGEVKTELAAAAFRESASSAALAPAVSTVGSAVDVRPFRGRWGDAAEHLQASQVLVGLDTARDRLTVAATLPRHAYNAWTQVADLGWSRHEEFGVQPCLACLYYPDRARSSEHELIAEALGQPPLRILSYLTYNVPIGFPIPQVPALADLPAPPDAGRWTQVPLIEDLIAAGVVDPCGRETWAGASIGSLYRDGICAGGLLPVGDLPGDVLVPLAHQSALAGIMLACELVWSRDPQLSARRDGSVEHRYDVLRGFPSTLR